jgi:hypothetical protein
MLHQQDGVKPQHRWMKRELGKFSLCRNNKIDYYRSKNSSKRFDFPGYHFSPKGLSVAEKTIEKFIARAVRVYD